jgi:hypothetical protein
MQAQLLSLFQLFIQLHFVYEITETLQSALDNLGIKASKSNIFECACYAQGANASVIVSAVYLVTFWQ